MSEVTQLATVGGKAVETVLKSMDFVAGTAGVRPHLPINLTDLSVDRSSQLPL